MDDGKGVWEEMLGDGIGLVFEPLQAGEDEESSGEGGGGSGEEDAATGPQQPEGRRNHDQDAEPGDLAG